MRFDSLFSLRSALITCGLLLLITFLYPLSGDNALYMYMADLLLKGHLPYIGSWDVNYPGIIFLHAFHVMLFGESVAGFHLLDIAIQLAGIYILYKLTLRLVSSQTAAFYVTASVTLYYVAGGLTLTGERDVYIALLIVASLYLLIKDGSKNQLMAGLLIGLALLMRPTVLAFLGMIGLWLVLTRKEKRWTTGLRFVGMGLLPIGLFLIWYGLLGHLHTFFEATYLYNTAVYAKVGMGLNDFAYLQKYWPLMIASPIGLWYVWRKSNTLGLLLCLVIVAGVIALVPVYRFAYHFHPLMVVLILLAVIGWSHLLERVRTRFSRATTFALGCLVMLGTLVTIVRSSQLVGAVRSFAASGSLTATHAAFYPSGEWGRRVQDSITAYFRSHLDPMDKVQFLTASMHLPLNASVEPANRFTSIYNLIWRSSRTNELVPMQHKWRKEFIRDVRTARFIVSSDELPDHVFNNGFLPEEVLAGYPELKGLLRAEYNPVRQFGGYTIYERKTREGAIAPSP